MNWSYSDLEICQAVFCSTYKPNTKHLIISDFRVFLYIYIPSLPLRNPSLVNQTTPFYSTGCITSPACRYIQGCRREWSGSQNYICIHKHVHVPCIHNVDPFCSVRWRVLLSFNCRNRLLLTGTPIQNTMQELWALLHFIMPTMFDSHEEFNEWFSRDIESHAEKKSALDESQLSRLHMILKPFMLRRIKRDVEHEMAEKV